MYDPRHSLLEHNAGDWQGYFVRFNGSFVEQERFQTSLRLRESQGQIQVCLTHVSSGQEHSMNFSTLPDQMQVSETGDWSLGPTFLTHSHCAIELCVVNQQQRRRLIVQQGMNGLDRVVYVIEVKGDAGRVEPPTPTQPLVMNSTQCGGYELWQPEPGVELLFTSREREDVEQPVWGLRWRDHRGETHQIVRRYGRQRLLEPLSPQWI